MSPSSFNGNAKRCLAVGGTDPNLLAQDRELGLSSRVPSNKGHLARARPSPPQTGPAALAGGSEPPRGSAGPGAAAGGTSAPPRCIREPAGPRPGQHLVEEEEEAAAASALPLGEVAAGRAGRRGRYEAAPAGGPPSADRQRDHRAQDTVSAPAAGCPLPARSPPAPRHRAACAPRSPAGRRGRPPAASQ